VKINVSVTRAEENFQAFQ